MSLKSKPMNQVRPLPAVTVLTQEVTVRINLNVPESVRHHWKIAALQQKLTLTDLIMKEMSKYSGEDESQVPEAAASAPSTAASESVAQ